MIKIQHAALSETIALDGGCNSAGLVLMPTLSYRKNMLYKAWSEAHSAIAAHGVNLDRQVALHFSGTKADIRSERPLLISGNVVVSANRVDGQNALVKNINSSSVIGLGDQPRTKDLVQFDDPDIYALPPSIQVGEAHSKVEKHIQIGHQACTKILSAFLDNLDA